MKPGVEWPLQDQSRPSLIYRPTNRIATACHWFHCDSPFHFQRSRRSCGSSRPVGWGRISTTPLRRTLVGCLRSEGCGTAAGGGSRGKEHAGGLCEAAWNEWGYQNSALITSPAIRELHHHCNTFLNTSCCVNRMNLRLFWPVFFHSQAPVQSWGGTRN